VSDLDLPVIVEFLLERHVYGEEATERLKALRTVLAPHRCALRSTHASLTLHDNRLRMIDAEVDALLAERRRVGEARERLVFAITEWCLSVRKQVEEATSLGPQEVSGG
jgi:hypothetical protein